MDNNKYKLGDYLAALSRTQFYKISYTFPENLHPLELVATIYYCNKHSIRYQKTTEMMDNNNSFILDNWSDLKNFIESKELSNFYANKFNEFSITIDKDAIVTKVVDKLKTKVTESIKKAELILQDRKILSSLENNDQIRNVLSDITKTINHRDNINLNIKRANFFENLVYSDKKNYKRKKIETVPTPLHILEKENIPLQYTLI